MAKYIEELTKFLASFSGLISQQSALGQSLFRGEAKAYPTGLMNGLARTYPWTESCDLKLDTPQRLQIRQSEARQWLEQFKREAYPFLNKDNTPTSELEWIILAQHYGFPTSLLDWTTNPLVALFFAIESHDGDEGYVYTIGANGVIDNLDDVDVATTQLKSIKNQSDIHANIPSYYDDALFIRPKYTDGRYRNQSTVLMLPRHPYIKPNFLEPDIIVIPAGIKKELRRHLRTLEITHSFIYPSLEGAAKTAKLKIDEAAIQFRMF
jgi:hypothetical protein